MIPINRRLILAATLVATAIAAAPMPAPAQQTPMKFTLDFVIQGPQAPFFLAAERGYYAREGINLDAVLQEPGYPKDRLPFVITVEACEE